MSDWRAEDWDPEEDKKLARKRCVDLGMDWLSFNGLIRGEWDLFEARLDAWARRKYAENGVQVPDYIKQKGRSRFREVLKRIYGTYDVDSDCETKFALPNEEELNQRFRNRANAEFSIRRVGSGGSFSETLAGIEAVRSAMTGAAATTTIPDAELAPGALPEQEPDWDAIADEVAFP